MKTRLLGATALGALLLPAGTAFAADAIVIPVVTPVVVVEPVAGPVVAVTLTQTVGRDTENDQWVLDTEIEVDVKQPTGLGVNLDLYNETIFPPVTFEPGFRFTVYKETGNFTLSAFAGMWFEIPAANRFWEVGLGAEATLGPADLSVELRREQQIGNPPTYHVEASAGFALGVVTVTPSAAFEFAGGPPTTTLGLELEVALGDKVTVIGGIEQELGGDRTLTLEVDFAVTDRVTLGVGVERVNTDGPTIWGGIEIAL
jgi:hypothetical protein